MFSSARLVSWLGPLSASPRFGSARLRGRPSCLAPLSFLCILLARPEEEGRRRCARHSGTERNLEEKGPVDGERRSIKLNLSKGQDEEGGFPSRQEMYVGTVNPVGCNGAEHGR